MRATPNFGGPVQYIQYAAFSFGEAPWQDYIPLQLTVPGTGPQFFVGRQGAQTNPVLPQLLDDKQ
jgi:hypothetical protein